MTALRLPLSLRRRSPRNWRGGVAASEFAVVAPVLALFLLSVYDVSNAIWRTTRLEMAARAGAQYAFSRPQDGAGIAGTVRGQLPGWAGVSVGPTAMTCRCDNGSAADCTIGTCLSGGVFNAPIGYVSITVTQPYRYLSPLTAALFPAFATLRGNAEVRVH